MSADADDFAAAQRYLRGELDDAERDAFEARLLEDDELDELTAAAETELIDLHVRDQLQGAARVALDRRLAQEPRLRAQRELSQLLFAAARPRESDVERAGRAAARRRRRWPWLVAPALLAAAAIALLLFSRDRGVSSPVLVSVVVPAPTRSSTIPQVELAPTAKRLRITLVAAVHGAEVVVVGPAGAVAAASVEASGSGVTVELDAAALVDGRYELTARTAGQPPQFFELRIVRDPSTRLR